MHQFATPLNNEKSGLTTLGRLLLELQQELDLGVLCAGNRLYHGCKITQYFLIALGFQKLFVIL